MLAFEGRRKWMQGPAGAFLSRLHELSWSWLGDGFVQDHFGLQWHFFHLPIQALQHRAREAWCRQLGEQLETRQGFKGLCSVDAAFTTAKLSKLSPDELGMMRAALNGSFFTNDKLVKTGKASSNTCNWCNGEDSLYHRYWECPFFHESRLRFYWQSQIGHHVLLREDGSNRLMVWRSCRQACVNFLILLRSSLSQNLTHKRTNSHFLRRFFFGVAVSSTAFGIVGHCCCYPCES